MRCWKITLDRVMIMMYLLSMENSNRPQVNWAALEAKAKTMDLAALHYARLDCVKTARALAGSEVKGKDEGYYTDEASVYAREMGRRQTVSYESMLAVQSMPRRAVGR